MTSRTPAEEEVANIECHIRMLLPEDYLASIGATVDAPNHKRELHHRCMRIFADLAERLTASPAAPEGETLCECGHPEFLHEDVEYRGDKPRACLQCRRDMNGAAGPNPCPKFRPVATPPAPPAPELDFVNAQTPLEPEARAILNRNRAELYLGPPAPVATMPEIEAGDKIRLWSLVSTSQWEVRETDGREIRCRVDGSDGWGEWLKASSVDEIERNGEVLWHRPDEGGR